MSHEVEWTNYIVNTFIEALRDEILDEKKFEQLEFIMRTRAKGYSRVYQHLELHVSLSTIDRRIKLLRKKYDKIRAERPELNLPVRKNSEIEKWMDNPKNTGNYYDSNPAK